MSATAVKVGSIATVIVLPVVLNAVEVTPVTLVIPPFAAPLMFPAATWVGVPPESISKLARVVNTTPCAASTTIVVIPPVRSVFRIPVDAP